MLYISMLFRPFKTCGLGCAIFLIQCLAPNSVPDTLLVLRDASWIEWLTPYEFWALQPLNSGPLFSFFLRTLASQTTLPVSSQLASDFLLKIVKMKQACVKGPGWVTYLNEGDDKSGAEMVHGVLLRLLHAIGRMGLCFRDDSDLRRLKLCLIPPWTHCRHIF